MWAGTGESQESLGSAQDGDGPRSLERTCTGKAGWIFTPQVKLWMRIAKEAQVSCSLVCGGVIDSQLIIHQKVAVSGLGESSPCGSSLRDAQFHRAPVGTVSQSSCGHSLTDSCVRRRCQSQGEAFQSILCKTQRFCFLP